MKKQKEKARTFSAESAADHTSSDELECLPSDSCVTPFEKTEITVSRRFQRCLIMTIFLGLSVLHSQALPVTKKDSLHWKTFTAVRPGLTRDPNMPAVNDSLKWVSNSAVLIYGKKDAVLVDVFMTIDQAKALADSVTATGKNLKYIYVTHPHADHYFGLKILLDRFPNAKALSTPAIAKDCTARIAPEIINSFWSPLFPGQIPTNLRAPQAMKGKEIDLEGRQLVVIEAGFSDTFHSTSIYVPSIGLIVSGDVVYNGIHPYLSETTSQTRKEWSHALDILAALHPRTVIVGHKKPWYSDSPDNIAATKKYLEDFESLNAQTSTAVELFNKMLLLYPDRANPGSLWGAALAAKKIQDSKIE